MKIIGAGGWKHPQPAPKWTLYKSIKGGITSLS